MVLSNTKLDQLIKNITTTQTFQKTTFCFVVNINCMTNCELNIATTLSHTT